MPPPATQARACRECWPRDPDRQRQPGMVTQQMDLRPTFTAIDKTGRSAPLAARTLTESIVHRDQASSPRAPSSSSTSRCSMAHTRAARRSAKRRCAVGPDGPNAGGNCCHAQPVVATKMIAANTLTIPYRRRPPPLRARRSRRHHPLEQLPQPSGTNRSTISTTASNLFESK